tara:strand:+ start:178 stop:525 length:348 start_codon:yes stop_codon:yes gene_type:complete
MDLPPPPPTKAVEDNASYALDTDKILTRNTRQYGENGQYKGFTDPDHYDPENHSEFMKEIKKEYDPPNARRYSSKSTKMRGGKKTRRKSTKSRKPRKSTKSRKPRKSTNTRKRRR